MVRLRSTVQSCPAAPSLSFALRADGRCLPGHRRRCRGVARSATDLRPWLKPMEGPTSTWVSGDPSANLGWPAARGGAVASEDHLDGRPVARRRAHHVARTHGHRRGSFARRHEDRSRRLSWTAATSAKSKAAIAAPLFRSFVEEAKTNERDVQVLSCDLPLHLADTPARSSAGPTLTLAVTASNEPFAGFAVLPWRDPLAARPELNRIATEHSLSGITLVGAPTGDSFIDDPVFWPVLARIAELKMPFTSTRTLSARLSIRSATPPSPAKYQRASPFSGGERTTKRAFKLCA